MRALVTIAAVTLALAACSKCPAEPEGAAKGGPPPMPPPLTMVQRPDATGGEAQFVQHCGACHGAMGMGTGLLARRSEVPVLDERTDLTRDYVTTAVRSGIGNMPAIARGEVSDAQLAEIAEYLAKAD